jgi:hypothetical protein
MPTYYVQPNGNNSWTGTSPTFVGGSTGPWQTISKALGASGITSGDTVYLAPGNYAESVTVGMSSAATTTYVLGDPTASMFSGVTAGPVRLTSYNAFGTTVVHNNNSLISCTSKNYLRFENILFESNLLGTATCDFITSTDWSFKNCVFESSSTHPSIRYTTPSSTALNFSVQNCIFQIATYGIFGTGGNVADNSSVINSLFIGKSYAIFTNNTQVNIKNCTFYSLDMAYQANTGSSSYPSTITNCLIHRCGNSIYSGAFGWINENYNRILASGAVFRTTPGTASTTVGAPRIEIGYNMLNNLNFSTYYGSLQSSPNAGYGTITNTPISDMYGVSWTNTNPDSGAITYRNTNSVETNISYVGGSPAQAQQYTISKNENSTSQSLELYLGATGVTYNTSGLQAYFVRNRSDVTAIALTNQTPNGSYISGGFCEINSSFMPGLYRLDVPNSAFSSGVDNVTITVRGATGTNGVVVNCLLAPLLTNSSIANTVWTNNERTLSATGISAFDIWNYANRTLTAASGATAYEIWNFNNRTLSSTGISAYDVWSYTDRIITGGTGVSITQIFPDNFEYMLITNSGRIYINKADIQKIKT